MSEIAEELARRGNPERLRALAKEEAMKRSRELRDQAVSRGKDMGDRALSSPVAVGAVGAVIGSVTGALIAKRYEKSGVHERERYGSWSSGAYPQERYGAGSTEILIDEETIFPAGAAESVAGYESGITAGEKPVGYAGGSSRSEELKGRASQKREELEGRAQDLKERVSEKSHELKERLSARGHDLGERASHLRERMPSRGEFRSRGSDVVHRAERHPAALVIGGIALGAITALVIPVTQAERRRVEPVKERARESIRSATEQLEERALGGGSESGEEKQGEYPPGEQRSEYQPPTVH